MHLQRNATTGKFHFTATWDIYSVVNEKTSIKNYGFRDTRKNNLHKILIENANINPIRSKLNSPMAGF